MRRMDTVDRRSISQYVEEEAVQLDTEIDRLFHEMSQRTAQIVPQEQQEEFAELIHSYKVQVMTAAE